MVSPSITNHSAPKERPTIRAILIHVALIRSRNDEETVKATPRSLLCFDAGSFFLFPSVASTRIFALVR
jgi:hypothetical protein